MNDDSIILMNGLPGPNVRKAKEHFENTVQLLLNLANLKNLWRLIKKCKIQ